MNRSGLKVLWCFLAMLGLFSPDAFAQVGSSGAHTTVRPGGAPNPLTRAIEAASSGDTLFVTAGRYAEPTLYIDKRLVLIGEKGSVLDGREERAIMIITADSVVIRGLEFENVGVSFVEDRAAIKVDDAGYCRIENNVLRDSFFGIYLARTHDCVVSGNRISGTDLSQSRSGNGIHLWYCKKIEITDNVVESQRDGIYLEFVEDSFVRGNLSRFNKRYGLHFMFSDRCGYRDNVFRQNNAGVAVMYTDHVEMVGNVFEDNWGTASFGLLLKEINDSYVAENRFFKNTIGIYAEGTNRTEFERNEFIRNGWAVKLMANASGNTFSANNFLGNSFDVSTNSRSSYSTFDGNYWDQYEGYDLNRDGSGDVPFRPVRLFSLMVEQNGPSLILLRSFFVGLLDLAERILPSLTPETLVDKNPVMKRLEWSNSAA